MAILIKTDGTMQAVYPATGPGTPFTLEELQKLVGGYIEVVRIVTLRHMVINEEGRLKNLPYNAAATALYGEMGQYIVGDAVIPDVGEME